MSSGDRRKFLRGSAAMLASAALIDLGANACAQSAGSAQSAIPQFGTTRPGRFDENTSILDRKRFAWPNGATLAIWIIPNVEVFILNRPGGATPVMPGDQGVLDFAWREYGSRVGLWRIADVMEREGIRATVALNAGVCDVWPKAVEKMKALGWEMMGHNVTNSRTLRGLPPDQEQKIIQTTVDVIASATGRRVRGWLGTGLAENLDTLDLLAERGVEYTGDWNNDDVPYAMKVKSGQMHAINYGNAVNDISFYRFGHTGEDYYQMIVNQFDTLYADSAKLPRVMGIPLHPFLTGQPLRIRYFEKAIQYMKQHDKVWFATGSEILDAYKSNRTQRGKAA